MVGAGDLKEKIGFYPVIAIDDGYGNTTNGYADDPQFVMSASIVPKLGGETILAGRLTGRNFANVTVRNSAQSRTVTTAWRAKNERTGVVYNIRSIIDPTQKRQWLEMLCEEGVAA